jgi:tetratricopeptide (TPR) repeat protein
MNVFRPGHRETGERIIETIKERHPGIYVEIILKPLDERMSEKLIYNMLNIPGFHHHIAEQIIYRSDGNPFFIEEVVRSFIDEGAVVARAGAFEVTAKMDTVVIPHTINDVLMARIDRLEEKTRDLIKIAAVIGRHFFYRILADVAITIENIDGRLSYLKEIQLVKERERMDEIEYLFKHALAQVAVYESILTRQRKKLHLIVADSIEKVFRERMHEFYGILSYHFIQGGDEEKAEDYLIKAGSEALKSSASEEALNYLQEALRLYLTKYGDAADPEKIAMIKKNIAFAFFYKGQLAKALEHLDSVLESMGVRSSRHKIYVGFKFIFDFLNLIAHLYLPLKKSSRVPDQRDHEIFNLLEKRVYALGLIDPQRSFTEHLNALKRCNKFDIRKIKSGVLWYAGASVLFSYGGISFKISRKILDNFEEIISENDLADQLTYELMKMFHTLLAGNWHECEEYDRELIDHNLRIGEIFHASTYTIQHGFMKIEQGAFEEAGGCIKNLAEIWEIYENENAWGYHLALKTKFLIKRRKLHDALIESEAGALFHSKIHIEPRRIYFLGFKAIILILLRDFGGAKKILAQAQEAVRNQGRVIPHFISSYLLAQFSFDLSMLEQAIASNDKPNIKGYRKKASKSGKKALRHSKKYAPDRTEIFKLAGLYFWLTGRQGKAIRWWQKSIDEGEHLKARVELSRTYMEIGKRFFEKMGKYKGLNEAMAREYLEKARIVFEDLDLQWDLNELDRISAYI